MRKNIFYFILGAIICGTTGVIASNLIASNINYTPSDTSWGVNNVEAAIDSLYVSKTTTNYSTDEKVVGTWLDGSPLYQKSFTTTINTNGTGWVTSDIVLNNEDIIRTYDVAAPSGNPFCSVIGGLIKGRTTTNVVDIYKGENLYSGNMSFVITIRYTKTTDQVNS